MFRYFLLFLICMMTSAEAQESARRIVRLESRIYGWYAVAEPAFDKTIGRRELFKVSGNDQFLKGLAGRLVLIEGVFSEGSLHLPALAPPPVSLPSDSVRRIVYWQHGEDQTEAGYRLLDPDRKLVALEPGSWKLDLLSTPAKGSGLKVIELLGSELREVALGPKQFAKEDQSAFVDLIVTQDLLNTISRIGLSQADLRANYQGVGLSLDNLNLRLPGEPESPWSLQGTVDVDFGGKTILAESSFVVDARPLIEDDILKLQPDWSSIRVEGQLPFSFILGTQQLGSYAKYLPSSIPVLPLQSVTKWFRGQGLLPQEADPHWYLGSQTPSTVRVALANTPAPLPAKKKPAPGNFRLTLGRQVVDRLMKRQVAKMLSPDTPYKPNPPIEVGKALFVPILVKEIYVRNIIAGYRDGLFRFEDLTIDVGWEAGPFKGLEPLLTTTGYVRPQLQGDIFTWQVVLEKLVVRSDKVPGNKDKLAAEFRPQIEEALGPKLAREQQLSNRLPLRNFLAGIPGELILLELQTLDHSLTLEGSLADG